MIPTPTPTVTATPIPTPIPSSDPAAQVVAHINAVRAANGLPPYAVLAGLNASAHQHDLTMAAGCGLSHQCPGEAAFGDRITAQGVSWSSAGENIATGGLVPNTAAAITSMAMELTDGMLAEVAPNDGHRRNLLSSGFHFIGVDIYRDAGGTVWMTQDFTS